MVQRYAMWPSSAPVAPVDIAFTTMGGSPASAEAPGPPRGALWQLGWLEGAAIPAAEVGARLVGRSQEVEDGRVGIDGSADRIVGQQELSAAVVEECRCRTD